MPKLNVFQSSTSTAGPTQTRQLTPSNLGASIRGFGSTVTSAAAALGNKIKEEQQFKANSQLVNAQAELFEEMETAKLTMHPSGTDDPLEKGVPGKSFSEKVDGMVKSKREKLLEGAESDFQRGILEAKMDAVWLSMFKHSKNYEIQAASAFESNKVRNAMVKSTNSARANPTFVDDLWQGQQELITDSPNILAKLKPKLLDQAKADLYDSALDGTVTGFVNQKNNSTQDVDMMIEMVKGGDTRWKNNSSRRGFDGALDRLEAYKARLNTQRKSESLDHFKESMTNMEKTGIDRKEYTKESIAALDHDETTTKRMWQRLDQAQRRAKSAPFINSTPIEDIHTDLESLNEQLKTADTDMTFEIMAEIDAKTHLLKDRERRAADNTPTYLMQVDPDLAQEFLEFEQLSSDPNASLEEIQQAATEWSKSVKAKTNHLWKGRVPGILPKNKIGQIARVIQGAGTNPQQLVQVMQREQQIWGQEWPLVVRDLKKAGALSSEQYVAATMYARPEVTYLADQMIEASTSKESEYKRDIGESVYNDIRRDATSALSEFTDTLRHMPSESFKLNKRSFVEAVTKLAAYKELKGETFNVSEIANKVVNENYNFLQGYRIPKEHEPIEIAEKIDGVYEQLADLEYFIPPHDAYRLGPEAAQKRVRNHVMSFARIVNDDNDEGVKLVDSKGNPVWIMEDGKAKIFKLTWDEIKTSVPSRIEREQDFTLIKKGHIQESIRRARGPENKGE